MISVVRSALRPGRPPTRSALRSTTIERARTVYGCRPTASSCPGARMSRGDGSAVSTTRSQRLAGRRVGELEVEVAVPGVGRQVDVAVRARGVLAGEMHGERARLAAEVGAAERDTVPGDVGAAERPAALAGEIVAMAQHRVGGVEGDQQLGEAEQVAVVSSSRQSSQEISLSWQ